MSNILNNYKNTRNYDIVTIKTDLSLCKSKIKKLQSLNKDNFSPVEIAKIQYLIDLELKKEVILKNKLKKLGYFSKQGRPKKNNSEKYSFKRSKFTAMLLPENVTYLKSLKSEKRIKNISEFLDELITTYRENSSL